MAFQYNLLDSSYTKKPWWKSVRIILGIPFLCATVGILYYGPQGLYRRTAEPDVFVAVKAPSSDAPPSKDVFSDDLWTNLLAVDAGWKLELTWDLWSSYKVEKLLQDPVNTKSYRRFLRFFRTPKVYDFVREYGPRCSSNQHLYTWLFSAYHSIPSGFGSNMNTALSNFVLVNEPEVRATHRFQFVEDKWLYAFLPNFFKDLGRTVNCSFFLDATRFLTPEKPAELRANVSFSRSNGVYIEEGRDVIMHHASVPWKRMLLTFTQLACRDGADLVFRKKSVIAKAVWQPVKILEDLLYLLWRQLAGPNGRYIALHIRRGDKIGTEMEDIPVDAFMEKLRELCPDPCSENVFVMTDDDLSYEAFLNLANGAFNVTSLQPLLEDIGLTASEYAVSSPGFRGMPPTDRQFWTTATKQIVLEITLLAMADQVICTMSSNICQLAVLLKGSYEGNVHSVDLSWEAALI